MTKSNNIFRRLSTFALIPEPPGDFLSTKTFQKRFYETLKSGAVPVLVGNGVDKNSLPFSEVSSYLKNLFKE